MLKTMQREKKLPTIVFKFDPTTCQKVAHDLLNYMEEAESNKYPHLRELKELQNKFVSEMNDAIKGVEGMQISKHIGDKDQDIVGIKIDREKSIHEKFLHDFKKEVTKVLSHIISKYTNLLQDATEKLQNKYKFYIDYYTKELRNFSSMTELIQVNVFAPHPEFTFSNNTVDMSTMIKIKNLLKEYMEQSCGSDFSNKKKMVNNYNIGYNHFFLKSIERGFVLYLNVLPVPFQRIAQMLIAEGGAPVTFSDKSLAYGVNYSIASTVLLGSIENDIIDRIIAHQAAGRSGRRGLDTKGYTIFCGVNWRELVSNEYLKITGANPDTEYMTLPKAFNTNFNMKQLAKVSLTEFIEFKSNDTTESSISFPEQITILEKEREEQFEVQHLELIDRLDDNNLMYIYRLSNYGILSEILNEFLLFLSLKMYGGLKIDKNELFELLAILVNHHDIEHFGDYHTPNISPILDEFKLAMQEKGYNVCFTGCYTLTRLYKKRIFFDHKIDEPENANLSVNMERLKHIIEIVRILYNQNKELHKINKWVDMLADIFNDLRIIIFKHSI